MSMRDATQRICCIPCHTSHTPVLSVDDYNSDNTPVYQEVTSRMYMGGDNDSSDDGANSDDSNSDNDEDGNDETGPHGPCGMKRQRTCDDYGTRLDFDPDSESDDGSEEFPRAVVGQKRSRSGHGTSNTSSPSSTGSRKSDFDYFSDDSESEFDSSGQYHILSDSDTDSDSDICS